MQESTENTNQPYECNLQQLAYKLIGGYEPEQIYQAFTDMDAMLKEWLSSENADDRRIRQDYLFSAQIINEIGSIVKGIPTKTITEFTEIVKRNTAKK